jgi:hypothetical protein
VHRCQMSFSEPLEAALIRYDRFDRILDDLSNLTALLSNLTMGVETVAYLCPQNLRLEIHEINDEAYLLELHHGDIPTPKYVVFCPTAQRTSGRFSANQCG